MPTDPLQLPLRDIHLPEDVAFWPLAYGWWILIVLIIGGLILAWFLYQRHLRKKFAAITLARQELLGVRQKLADSSDPKGIVKELSVLLRRVTISLYPRADSASLTGEDWLKFLDQASEQQTFLSNEGRILIEGPYRPKVSHNEVEPLLSICEAWLMSLESKQGKHA